MSDLTVTEDVPFPQYRLSRDAITGIVHCSSCWAPVGDPHHDGCPHVELDRLRAAAQGVLDSAQAMKGHRYTRVVEVAALGKLRKALSDDR